MAKYLLHFVIAVLTAQCVVYAQLDITAVLSQLGQFSQFNELSKNYSHILNGTSPEQLFVKGIEGIKEKCETESGKEDTFDNLQEAITTFSECVNELMDIDVFKNEIEMFSKNGSLEEVFGKYCGRRQRALACIDDVKGHIKNCLNENEKTKVDNGRIIIGDLLEFLCFKEGDHIALFISEEGPECFTAQKDGLITCAESEFNRFYKKDSNDPFDFTFNQFTCNDIDPFKDCGVRELEKCENSTPANLFESLLRYLKKKCNEIH